MTVRTALTGHPATEAEARKLRASCAASVGFAKCRCAALMLLTLGSATVVRIVAAPAAAVGLLMGSGALAGVVAEELCGGADGGGGGGGGGSLPLSGGAGAGVGGSTCCDI